MPNPRPIKALVTHETQYALAIKKKVVDPMFNDIRSGLAEAVASSEAIHAINSAHNKASRAGVPNALIRKQFNGLAGYHKKALIQTFQAALGIDMRPVLTEQITREFLNDRIAENVRLIKTIPDKFHQGLLASLQDELEFEAFNEQRLSKLLTREYGISGYNVRRIARDQTTKTIGGLTEIRQKQAGIAGYIWRTSGDESVRPTHAAHNGKFFLWANPPVATGHPGNDIQCRCTAEPVVRKVDRERLKRQTGYAAPTKAKRAPGPAPPKPPPPPKPPGSFANFPQPETLDDYIAEGARIQGEIEAQTGRSLAVKGVADGEAEAFRKALVERLKDERGAGKLHLFGQHPKSAQAKKAMDRVRKETTVLPESWIKYSNDDIKYPLKVKTKAGYSSDHHPISKQLRLSKYAKDGTPLHEFVHHVQSGNKTIQELFQKLHNRLTAGEKMLRFTPGRER